LLTDIANGRTPLSDLASGKCYLIRPDEQDSKTFYIRTKKSSERKVSSTELHKLSFSRRDCVLLVKPYEQYGIDLQNKCMVVINCDLKTSELLLNL